MLFNTERLFPVHAREQEWEGLKMAGLLILKWKEPFPLAAGPRGGTCIYGFLSNFLRLSLSILQGVRVCDHTVSSMVITCHFPPLITHLFPPSHIRCLAAVRRYPPPACWWLSGCCFCWCHFWPAWWPSAPLCCTPSGHRGWRLRGKGEKQESSWLTVETQWAIIILSDRSVHWPLCCSGGPQSCGLGTFLFP